MKILSAFALILASLMPQTAKGSDKPNIVFVMCDDLGYGDVQCLNPENGKILTPHIDRLAEAGMIFTDAHSGSSVCTPTRYGLLTGRYSWRTSLQRGVVQGFAPCLITEDRPTVASYLKKQGYHTAIIGKWHLNFQYADPESGDLLIRAKGKKSKTLAPVSSKIPDGPIHRGFDYFHGFHHAGDMKGVIENDTVIAHDEEINMLPRITREAVKYIDQRAETTPDQPFFLYVPYGSPHTPILPTEAWQGKSGLGDYGDFVMETDAGFGEILAALDRHKMTDNTLVIFTSDNGCSRAADIKQLEKHGHHVSAHLRGSKADLWDGGHRIPFIARWPEQIESGSTTDQLICLTDLFSTCSDLLASPHAADAAEDSVSILPVLKGEPIVTTRKGIVHHSISGHFGYRQGKWKLLLARGSGGWSDPKESTAKNNDYPEAQLYNMVQDPGEERNLYIAQPEVAKSLLYFLKSDIKKGRSTEGAPAENDFDKIVLWKTEDGEKNKKKK